MSTAPVSPITAAPTAPVVVNVAPAAATSVVTATPIRTFLKMHETLLIFVFGFLLIWFVSGKVENIIAAHDSANLKTVQATLNAEVKQNAETAALVAQQAADYKALASKVDAQNAALEQANVALATALTKQQKTDDLLPMSSLLTRWEQLVPKANFDGSPILPDGGVAISPANAHATVDTLEQVPVLSAELGNEKAENQGLNQLLSASTEQVATLNTNVDGLKLQIADDAKVCKAEIKVVKDAARKSKRRWFIIGFVSGFFARQAIKTETGF